MLHNYHSCCITTNRAYCLTTNRKDAVPHNYTKQSEVGVAEKGIVFSVPLHAACRNNLPPRFQLQVALHSIDRFIYLFIKHHNSDNTRVNSHQRWKQTRFRVCFHLWCELTTTINLTECQVSWNTCCTSLFNRNYEFWKLDALPLINRLSLSLVLSEIVAYVEQCISYFAPQRELKSPFIMQRRHLQEKT